VTRCPLLRLARLGESSANLAAAIKIDVEQLKKFSNMVHSGMTEQDLDGFRGDDLLHRANSFLRTLIAKREWPRTLHLPENFIYQHAKNILSLGDDVELLIVGRRNAGVAIITRTMLEGFFNLQATAEDDTFAARKIVWEINEWLRRSEMMPFQLNQDAQAGLDLARRFCKIVVEKYGVKTSRSKLDVFHCAKAANTEGIFRNQYFLLSLRSHGEIMGIVGREFVQKLRFSENAAIFCTEFGLALTAKASI
jgi:hypothetical protein